MSLRYANGRVRTRVRTLFYNSDPKPESSSEVFVQMKIPSGRTDILPLMATARMMASLVTIIVMAKR